MQRKSDQHKWQRAIGDEPKKERLISVRLTEGDWENLKYLSEKRGISMAGYIRMFVREQASEEKWKDPKYIY